PARRGDLGALHGEPVAGQRERGATRVGALVGPVHVHDQRAVTVVGLGCALGALHTRRLPSTAVGPAAHDRSAVFFFAAVFFAADFFAGAFLAAVFFGAAFFVAADFFAAVSSAVFCAGASPVWSPGAVPVARATLALSAASRSETSSSARSGAAAAGAVTVSSPATLAAINSSSASRY